MLATVLTILAILALLSFFVWSLFHIGKFSEMHVEPPPVKPHLDETLLSEEHSIEERAKRYRIKLEYDPLERDYVAQCLEFPYILAFGDTPEEAVRDMRVALEGAIQVHYREGWVLPEPSYPDESTPYETPFFTKETELVG